MRWLLNWHGVIDMETKTLMEPVEKYFFGIDVDASKSSELNREIRDWLGQNCACTWETKIELCGPFSMDFRIIEVYFDMDTPEDEMMAFKLRWI